MSQEIHQNDIGKDFVVETGVALAGASVHDLVFLQPDGSILTREGTIDGTTLTYTSVSTDFLQAGTHKVESSIAFGAGSVHRGKTHTFQVLAAWAS